MIHHANRRIDTTLDSWCREWSELGLTGRPPDDLHASMLAHYRQPHRAYHTLQHLDECFALLSEARNCPRLAEISLALWFHDAIYDTTRSDNEAASADWLAEVAYQAGAPTELNARLHALVMATRHSAIPQDHQAQLLVDIDLSILGAPEHRFDEYEQQIREEYIWVPEPLYRQKRSDVLQAFLQRPLLYCTADFRSRFEMPARKNLRRSLQSLQQNG
jgi:predicted metal-dependent HD superfamily phosphohydrolase